MPVTSDGEILQTVDLNAKATCEVAPKGTPTTSILVCAENEKPRTLTSHLRCVLFDSSKAEDMKEDEVPKESNKVGNEGSTSTEMKTRFGVDVDTAQNLNDIASGHALRGNETTAIKIYQRAIALTTCELDRIEKRIEKHLGTKKRNQKHYSELLSEWKDVTLIVAETKMMMAVLYERMGDYDAAIITCKEGCAVCERLLFLESNDCTIIEVQEQFFLMYHMVTKLEEAKETFQERKDLQEAALQMYNEVQSTHDGKDRGSQLDAVLDKLFAALSLEMNSLGEHHPQVAATHEFISKVYLKKNDRSKALQTMKYAVGTAEIALGGNHPTTANKYCELARQYEGMDRNKYDQAYAMVYYQKALDIFEQAEGNCARMIVAILNDMGVLQLKQGKHKDAIQHLRRAVAVYESMTSQKEDGTYTDIAQVWRNLARCYVIDKQWDMAEVNFSSALYVQREARKAFDTRNENDGPKTEMPFVISDECIVDTMKRMGKVYTAMQEYNKADGILIEALTMYQDACEDFKAKFEDVSPLELAARQDRIAEIIYCLAKVQEELNSFDDAIRLYDEAMELRLYSDKVRDSRNKLNHVHIAMCLAGIGKMRLAKHEHSSAFKVLNEAIQNAMKEGKE